MQMEGMEKGKTKYRNLKGLGIEDEEAWKNANTRKGYWRLSRNPIINSALTNKYWQKQGLKTLTAVIS